MFVGHTKMLCDGFFGLIKRLCRQESRYSPADVYDVVRSEISGVTPVCASEVDFRKWKPFLEQYFDGTIPLVSSKHQIRFQRDKPGYVEVRDYPDEPWTSVRLRKTCFPDDHTFVSALRSGADGLGYSLSPDLPPFCPLSDLSFKASSKPLKPARVTGLRDIEETYFIGETLEPRRLEFRGNCHHARPAPEAVDLPSLHILGGDPGEPC